jgi:tetratricopeptide (TPR) repeat protein
MLALRRRGSNILSRYSGRRTYAKDEMSGKRVLALAWSAVEWGVVHPMLDRGELPHLASLVEAGVSGPLTTLPPLLLPIVATTVASGFHPPAHGVLAPSERRPDGGGVQPVGARSWTRPALWQTLTHAGKKTAVVNWPATMPATQWPDSAGTGIVIDERFALAEGKSFEAWPLPLDAVTPHRLRDVMRDLRVHPADIGAGELSALLGGLDGIDGKTDPRPARLAASLARTASVHAAATHVAETEDWDLLLVHYPLIADVWRDLAGIADDTARYARAATGACRLLDVMLGRLLELAGADTDVFIIGPAGWRRSGLAMGDADEHSMAAYDGGLLVARGEGIKRDALFHRAAAVDIAPTLLACFGLVAPGDGQVLTELFVDGAPATQPVPPLPVRDAMAAAEDADLSAAQKKALTDDALTRLRNLADAYLALHHWDDAAAVLARALAIAPDDYASHLKRGRILLLRRDWDGAQTHARAALALQPDQPWGDLLLGSIHAARGDGAKAGPHLDRAYALGGALATVNLPLGWAAIMVGRWRDAQKAFRAALASDPNMAEAHTGLGVSLQGEGRGEDAETSLRRAIALSYDNAVAHFHLGQILAGRGARQEAVSALRLALAQNPQMQEAAALLAKL